MVTPVTPRFLLDTDIWSVAARRQPDRAIVSRLALYRFAVAIAATSFHELLYGASRLPVSERRREIEQFIDTVIRDVVPILPYDADAAAWHAAERVRLVSTGLTPPFADGQIAAVAVVHDLTLVTRNPRDFQHFRDLRMDDWRS